ncbi:hypothetical protein D046_5156, partial [Vibrio parahaemolyticus V-223/04]
LTSSTGISN